MNSKQYGKFFLYLACSFLPVLLSSNPAIAQSIDIKKPAALQSGPNTGTADNFVGAHYWYFNAAPGSFTVTLTRQGSPGDAGRANLIAKCSLAPAIKGEVVTSKTVKEITTFTGSVKQPTKVVVSIDPGPSGLVRSACNYELHAAGTASFAPVAGGDPVVGTYMAMRNDYGGCKFLADGTIVCVSGAKGKWTLFDKNSLTYNLVIGEAPNVDSSTLTLVPARGLVDAASPDIVIFKLLK